MESITREKLLAMLRSEPVQLSELLSLRFKEVDANLREQLLMDILKTDYSNWGIPFERETRVAKIIQDNFQDISQIERERILSKFMEDCKREYVDRKFMRILLEINATNFNDVPKNLQAYLLELNDYFGSEYYT